MQDVVNQIDQAQIQKQMRVPIAVSTMLPAGLKGVLCMIILMGVMSGDGMHLHSWGSIFVQDLLVPLRKKPFAPQEHIRTLRWSLVGVAVFALIFGSLFRQTEYVVMWFNVTTAIYVGGAGAAILGGLYWKKGTTAGAWSGLLTGSLMSVGGIVIRQFNPDFFLNGTQISFFATLCAIAVYVVVSWLTCREDFNMDRLLHRGKYTREENQPTAKSGPVRKTSRLWEWIGVDAEFTRSDRWIAGGIFWWSMFWFGVFVVVSVWNLIQRWTNETWAAYWHVSSILLPLVVGVLTTIWFTIGGLSDMVKFFRRLRAEEVDERDDGTVVGHRSLDELP